MEPWRVALTLHPPYELRTPEVTTGNIFAVPAKAGTHLGDRTSD